MNVCSPDKLLKNSPTTFCPLLVTSDCWSHDLEEKCRLILIQLKKHLFLVQKPFSENHDLKKNWHDFTTQMYFYNSSLRKYIVNGNADNISAFSDS